MTVGNLEGRVLNERYQVQTLIGQGGMAAVYKAYDPNLRRSVAIKIIHPHLSNDTEFFRRFEEEATAVAHLRHPNIVQMYDFNHDGDLYYMVMEYIAGETLQTRLKRLNQSKRRMPIKDALVFTQNICEAAEYAHERGMIHRDIKPANVMLDVHGKAILMDFGIARIVSNIEHTATGAVLGTAMYMAPEQIQGLHADARADIYSIGVTLFEMLSGRPPFEADSAMTVMMMHLNDPVPDIHELQPDVPVELVGLIDQAMAKDRNKRFQTAAQMSVTLKAVTSETTSPGLAAAAGAVRPAAMAVETTFIESPGSPGSANATFLETPVSGSGAKAAAAVAGATLIEQPIQGYQPASKPVAVRAFPVTPDQSAYPVKQKKGKTGLFIILVLVILIAAGGFFAYQKYFANKGFPLALASASTEVNIAAAVEGTTSAQATRLAALQPTQIVSTVAGALTAAETSLPSITTSIPESASAAGTAQPILAAVQTEAPTATLEPTPTETSQPAMVIGGADKIAFFNGGNIWMANLDGSGLTQLTQDGTQKSNLRWMPDGQGLSYISGKCIHTVSIQGEDAVITCFNNAKYLKAFEISPDGTQLALSLDNELYLLPFDLELLKNAHTHEDLASIAPCADLAPYKRNFGTAVRWSKDNQQWAAEVLGVLKDGQRGDLIEVFAVNRCIPNPLVKVQFPEPHFTYKGYENTRTIENFDWDGDSLFVFNDNKRNDGFGDLHIFSIATFKPIIGINPIRNVCCYRDARWSPDGSYLVFAFQDYMKGSNSTTQLYMIPYGDIGTGGSFDPLPLPEITDPKEKPQPVLRPAVP